MYYKREHCDACGHTVEFYRDGSQAGHADGCAVGAATLAADQRPVRVKYLVDSGPADKRKAVGDEEDLSPAAAAALVAAKAAEYVEVKPVAGEAKPETVRVRHLGGGLDATESEVTPGVAAQLVADKQAVVVPKAKPAPEPSV